MFVQVCIIICCFSVFHLLFFRSVVFQRCSLVSCWPIWTRHNRWSTTRWRTTPLCWLRYHLCLTSGRTLGKLLRKQDVKHPAVHIFRSSKPWKRTWWPWRRTSPHWTRGWRNSPNKDHPSYSRRENEGRGSLTFLPLELSSFSHVALLFFHKADESVDEGRDQMFHTTNILKLHPSSRDALSVRYCNSRTQTQSLKLPVCEWSDEFCSSERFEALSIMIDMDLFWKVVELKWADAVCKYRLICTLTCSHERSLVTVIVLLCGTHSTNYDHFPI